MYNRWARIWWGKKPLLQAACILFILRVALVFLPYRSVRDHVLKTSQYPQDLACQSQENIDLYQATMVWAIQLTGRYLLGYKPCLPQALAIQWFLRKKGIKTRLNIGVKKDDNSGIAAHAWVEREGKVIMGGEMSPQHFKRLRLVKS